MILDLNKIAVASETSYMEFEFRMFANYFRNGKRRGRTTWLGSKRQNERGVITKIIPIVLSRRTDHMRIDLHFDQKIAGAGDPASSNPRTSFK